MEEEGSATYNWSNEETRALIQWRGANEALFTGKRNSSKSGWEVFVKNMAFPVTAKQVKKKCNNLKGKYKELRDPPTGKGVEAGGVTAATWQWYTEMDAVLQGQHSINPPLVVAANLSAIAGGIVASSSSAPHPSSAAKKQCRKRQSSTELTDLLREQAEREEERERQKEERERAATDRAERYLALFEKLVNKL